MTVRNIVRDPASHMGKSMNTVRGRKLGPFICLIHYVRNILSCLFLHFFLDLQWPLYPQCLQEKQLIILQIYLYIGLSVNFYDANYVIWQNAISQVSNNHEFGSNEFFHSWLKFFFFFLMC